MFCWRTICFSLSVIVLLTGTSNFAHAQTVFRDIEQQKKEGQTAVIGLLGEFSHCAAYQVANQDLVLNQVIPRAGGLTENSSGIIRIIRNGRISQDLFYSPETAFPLMHGDILIAMKSPANLINESFNNQRNANNGSQQQSSPELIQVAIVNLLERPVVFGVQPEIADLAGILRCLRQPVEKYSKIANSIKVISSQRVNRNINFKTKKLTTKLSSATVLVLNSKTGIDLSLVPKSLPAPKSLQPQLSSLPDSGTEQNTLVTAPLETPSFQKAAPEATPEIRVTNQNLRKVTHPEDLSLPNEKLPLKKTDEGQLQLNGPLLQQTTASLSLVPKPNLPQKNEGEEKTPPQASQSTNSLPVTPENPKSEMKAAPLPPVETIQTLEDEGLDKYEDFEENASSSSSLHWSSYLFLAFVAVMVWKYRRKIWNSLRVSNRSHHKSKSLSLESTDSQKSATVITNWESLPPLPEKSLLEQILENDIPVFEEAPQIPTQTLIYGRHQSKSARIDQQESLKGPHFVKQPETEPTVSEKYESTKTVPSKPLPQTTGKILKAPAFRFDRPHPGSSQSVDEINTSEKADHLVSSHSARSSQPTINKTSGILDRVLQAVQGVIQK